MPDGIFRVLCYVPLKLLQPLFLTSIGIAIHPGAIASNRILRRTNPEILIVGHRGIAVISGIFGCSRQSQQNVRPLWRQLPGLRQHIYRTAEILERRIHQTQF